MVTRIIIQYVFFILIRYLTIAIGFMAGFTGGNYSNTFLEVYIFIPGLIFQILFLYYLFKKKNGIAFLGNHLGISIIMIVILFLVSAFDLISNSIFLPK